MLRYLLFLLFFIFSIALSPTHESSAQFFQFAKDAGEKNSMESMMETAKRDGVSIMVISPDGSDSSTSESSDQMRSEMFLTARARIRDILSSSVTLWPRMQQTIHQASPHYPSSSQSQSFSITSEFYWLFQALLITLGGLLFALLVAHPTRNWLRRRGSILYTPNPVTTADKAQYLLLRTFLTLVYTFVLFIAALLVALIFDPAWEPSRRVIFEIIVAFSLYNILRYAISWNFTAYDAPDHRLINANDKDAATLHRDWWLSSIAVLFITSIARIFSITGQAQLDSGLIGGLTLDHIALLQLLNGFVFIFFLLLYTVKNWKILSHIFAPQDSLSFLFRAKTFLTSLIPAICVFYACFAFGVFMFRLALDYDQPGRIIADPFFVFYPAIIIYGLVLLLIQYLYTRRYEKFRLLAEEASPSESNQTADKAADKTDTPTTVDFEYKPMFRTFFESSAMSIIMLGGLRELGTAWGIEGDLGDSLWGSMMDILLAIVLCFLAYRALGAFINKRIEEEGGVPDVDDEAEAMGEGGGAGESRMATLLPIMRYVMVTFIFSVALIIGLSKLGFDIGPIFAGAGVVGIAIGFGAQTLIRDIFSGAFFLIDDAFRKGEYVEIEGIKGSVEKISVRSFQLRHHLGALHTIPFGEIHQLTNYSRDWVMMKLPLRVTYDTDVEKVRKLVKNLGQQLLDDPAVGHTFMQPLKSQGVYKMEDSAMIIRVKFMTKPGEQFVTRKVVYQSIQDLFAREGIRFAHKEVTVRVASDTPLNPTENKAAMAAARSVIDDEEEAKLQLKKGDGDR